MGYRDDTEALRAKVEHLERELDDARGEIARLRGEAPRGTGAAVVEGPGTFWLGAPTRLRFRRALDGDLDGEDQEAIVEALQELFDAEGNVSVVGSTFRWSLRPPGVNRIVDVRIKSKGGRTTIRITERLGNLAGGLFGGIVGGVGGGGVAGVAMGAAAILGAWAAPLAGVLWVVATYGAVRTGYAATVKRRAAQLIGALDEIEALVRARARGSDRQGPRARVGDASTPEPLEVSVEAAEERGSGGR